MPEGENTGENVEAGAAVRSFDYFASSFAWCERHFDQMHHPIPRRTTEPIQMLTIMSVFEDLSGRCG